MSRAVSVTTFQTKITPVVSASVAYSSGDQVGDIQTISRAIGSSLDNTSVLRNVSVIDQAGQSAALQIFLFSELPVVASIDNGALDITDAQMSGKCLGVINIPSANYVSYNNGSVATISDSTATGNLPLTVKCTELTGDAVYKTGKIYAVVKTTGTPTYASVSDLVFTYSFEQ